MSKVVKAVVGVAATVVGIVTGQGWLVGIGLSLTISGLQEVTANKGIVGASADKVSYDPTYGRELGVGIESMPGSMVDEFSHDILPHVWDGADSAGDKDKNRVEEKIYALKDHECDGLVEVWDGSRKLTLGDEDTELGFPVTEYRQSGRDHLWIKFHSGAWDQAADAHLVAVSDGRWTSADRGRWNCYARVTLAATKNSSDTTWAAGAPDLRFVVRGLKLYDPRKDSSVGGSGAHRFADRTTYEFSQNEPLIRYNIIRGIYRPDGKLFYGVGASHEEVPFDDAVAAMNAADEAVDLKAGGTEPRYRAGGTISLSRAPRDAITALEQTSAGRTINVAGRWRIFVGVAQAPVMPFTDGDALIKNAYTAEPKYPSDALVNAVYGSYIDPTAGYTKKTLPVRRSSDDIAEDGGFERSANLDMPFCRWPGQGQRVQEIARRRARRQIRHSRTLKPRFYEAEPGDSLAWTSDKYGYTAKPFWIESQTVDSKINVDVSLIEDDDEIYDWDKTVDELDIAGGDLPSADPPAALLPVITDFTVDVRTGTDGSKVPTLHIEFEDPNDASATGLTVQVRKVGTAEVVEHKYKEASAGVADIVQGLLAETAQEFRAAFDALPGRDTQWTDWTPFITLPSKLKTFDELRVSDADRGVRDLIDQQDKLANALISASWASQQAIATVGKTVANATFTLDKKFTDGLSAAAVALLLLSARVDGILTGDTVVSLTSRVTVLEAASADLYTRKADATALTALSSQVNDPSTGILASITSINATLATLDPTSSAATIQQSASAIRTAERLSDDVGNALITALGLLSNTEKRVNTSLAYYTSTIDARVTAGLSSTALSIHELGVALQTADATLQAHITAAEQASVDAVSAEASARQSGDASINAVIGNGFTSGSTITAQFATELSARAAADAAETAARTSADSAFTASLATTNANLASEATTRAAADSAETASRTAADSTLTSGLATTNANLGTEATTRAAADSSETAARTAADSTLTTNLATTAAALTTESTTRASADSAETAARTAADSTLTTNLATTDANLASEATTRASADSAETAARTSADSTLTTNLATTAANLATEATTRASADTAETSARTAADSTLTTNLATTAANLATEATTRASADTAETSARTAADSTLTTNLATTNANLSSEATTRAAADSAETSARTAADSTLTTGLATANAAITSEATTRAAADSANASDITTIYSYFGAGIDGTHTVAAKITTEATTRAAADSAIATDTATALAQLGNLYASGLIRIAAAATASGSDATVSLAAAASSGGSPYTAALYLDARSTGETRITAVAGAFYITDGTNTAKPFVFTGSTLYVNALVATSALVGTLDASIITTGTLNVGTLIAANAIVTGKLATNAVTESGGYGITQQTATVTPSTPGSTSFTLQFTAGTVLVSDGIITGGIATTSTAGSILIFLNGQIKSTSGATTNVTAHIDYSTNGGTSWTNCPAGEGLYRLSANPLTVSMSLVGVAPAGTNRIRVTLKTDAVDVIINNAKVEYLVVKR